MIVPTLCVGMHPVTLRVTITQMPDFRLQQDAERPGRHSHAERGNDQTGYKKPTVMSVFLWATVYFTRRQVHG
ncbi:hypothetical protein CUU62_11965 [Pseudomonas sp. WP001]|nr:hypothetical protein CUU62_11965 [Pseudomonas sp. WP001]